MCYIKNMKYTVALNRIVTDCILQHEGGERFFDALDEQVRSTPELLEEVYALALGLIPHQQGREIKIIVSGNFGKVFLAYFANRIPHSIVCVPGGLRKGNTIDALEVSDVANADFIFIDASFYSGSTRNVVKTAVNFYGANLLGTAVVYDGSLTPDDSVHSLYRYHD